MALRAESMTIIIQLFTCTHGGDCVIGNLEYGELFERDRGLEGFRGKCPILLLLLLLFLLFRGSKGGIGIDGKSGGI